MNVMTLGCNTAKAKAKKPLGFVKGEEFERFVRARLFPRSSFTLLDKTHSWEQNDNDFVVSSNLPDFRFKDKSTRLEFLVEAKYRSSLRNWVFKWCEEYQLKRYQEIDKNTPVFVAIGRGGQSSLPKRLFLIPVKHMKNITFVKLFPSFLNKYEIHLDRSNCKRDIEKILYNT